MNYNVNNVTGLADDITKPLSFHLYEGRKLVATVTRCAKRTDDHKPRMVFKFNTDSGYKRALDWAGCIAGLELHCLCLLKEFEADVRKAIRPRKVGE